MEGSAALPLCSVAGREWVGTARREVARRSTSAPSASGLGLGRKEPKSDEFVAERGCVCELNGVKPEYCRRFDIGSRVVDEDGGCRFDAEPLDEAVKDASVWFVHSGFSGEEDPFKPTEEVISLSGDREQLGRPVAQRQ